VINRKFNFLKYVVILMVCFLTLNVNATIKCESGKPGDTVNCTIKNSGYTGSIKKISVDDGLTFASCDVCDESQYTIEVDKTANFKFKISSDIQESKKLNVSFGGESAKVEVVVENDEEDGEESDVTYYTVTLIPGNGSPEKTLTCSVNSLNATCSVTLESLDDENFNGWGQKGCTEGATGSVKVNKITTYYACYKKDDEEENESDTLELNRELLLNDLVVKNGDEVINFGFSIRIFEYSIIVPKEVTSLNVNATSSLEDIEIEVIGKENLDKDENVVKVVLTDKNNSKNEYVLNVIKSDEKPIPFLSSLVVGGYNIEFDSKKFNYDLTIDSGIKSLTINAVPEKEEYEYEIIGQNNIKDGSQIKVIVSDSENDTSTTYIINIKQDTSNLLIYIAIGGVILLILIILLIIVVKKGKSASKGGDNSGKKNKKIENNKVKQVNIPDAKPVIPTAPVAPTTVSNPMPQGTNQEKENIEVLDF